MGSTEIEYTDDDDEAAGVEPRSRRAPILRAGLVLGAALGGLLEAFVFQQLLQYHHMLSSTVPPLDTESLSRNVRWDGAVALGLIALLCVGLAMLWSAARRGDVVMSTRSFALSLGVGWCAFNLVEGVVAHHLLGIHHVRYGADMRAWDLGYLIASAVLLVVLTNAARRDATSTVRSTRSPEELPRGPSPEPEPTRST